MPTPPTTPPSPPAAPKRLYVAKVSIEFEFPLLAPPDVESAYRDARRLLQAALRDLGSVEDQADIDVSLAGPKYPLPEDYDAANLVYGAHHEDVTWADAVAADKAIVAAAAEGEAMP